LDVTFPKYVSPPSSVQTIAFAAIVPGTVFILGCFLIDQGKLQQVDARGSFIWGVLSIGLVLAVETAGILLLWFARIPLILPRSLGVFLGVWSRLRKEPTLSKSLLWRKIVKVWFGDAAPRTLTPGLPLEEFKTKLTSMMMAEWDRKAAEAPVKMPGDRDLKDIFLANLRESLEWAAREVLLEESDLEWQTVYEVLAIHAFRRSPATMLDMPSIVFASSLGLWLAAWLTSASNSTLTAVGVTLCVGGMLEAVAYGFAEGSVGSSTAHSIAAALEGYSRSGLGKTTGEAD